MLLNKFLRFVNYAIALALLAVLGAGYWYLYRPMPQESGTLTAPVAAQVTVGRDALGVPHIRASRMEDALFAQGFVTAQDRLWQMDVLRRLGSGQLSEVIGPSALESDRTMRRLRMGRIAEEQAARLPEADRATLAAYARGVNYFIETNRNRLPVEFKLLRYDPRPWTITDSVVVGLEMFRSLTESWKDEILKAQMLEGGNPAMVNSLFPVRSGVEGQPGSNAWVVSGRWTADGRPILANDPHLEFTLPATWYMMHLTWPQMNVSGATLPGLPGVLIGHNDRVAWGITNLLYDVQDLYIENIDPATGRYLYRGQVEQARPEREVIAVRGARAIESTSWVTWHGPVAVVDNGKYLSLRWSAAEPGLFQYPVIEIDQARNWQEFTAALSRFPGPCSNFVYADVDGNIGYHAAGKMPIRHNYDGDVPVDGSSGTFEWDGWIPFDQLPSFYNPPSGMIVTANQNPFPENYGYRVSGRFAAPYRSAQIRALLSAHRQWRASEMLGVQRDVYSAFSHFLAKQTVAAYDRRGLKAAGLDEAVQILRTWNGQMEIGQAAPVLTRLLFDRLKEAVVERASPGKGATYNPDMASAVIEKLLLERPKAWFADYDQLLLRSLIDAVDQGKRMLGRNPAKWNYGNFNSLTLIQPVCGRLPLGGRYFNIGPVPMSGSRETVKQIKGGLGPSMRMVVELGNLDGSLQNITVGESAHILSPHYHDQWAAYYYGHSFPMQFTRVDVKKTLVIEPGRP